MLLFPIVPSGICHNTDETPLSRSMTAFMQLLTKSFEVRYLSVSQLGTFRAPTGDSSLHLHFPGVFWGDMGMSTSLKGFWA